MLVVWVHCSLVLSASGRIESEWTLAKLDLNDGKNSELVKIRILRLNDFKSLLGFTCLKDPEAIVQALQKTHSKLKNYKNSKISVFLLFAQGFSVFEQTSSESQMLRVVTQWRKTPYILR